MFLLVYILGAWVQFIPNPGAGGRAAGRPGGVPAQHDDPIGMRITYRDLERVVVVVGVACRAKEMVSENK